MKLTDLGIADGYIRELLSKTETLTVVFVDWQQKSWIVTFRDVVAFENYNCEGEELIEIQITHDANFSARVVEAQGEPISNDFKCFEFISAWKNKCILRILAGASDVAADISAAPNHSVKIHSDLQCFDKSAMRDEIHVQKLVKATFEFGILIRAKSILEKGLDRSQITSVFDNEEPIDSNEVLLSYGPHFGTEAMENIGNRLVALGLEYIDDFFYLQGDFPDWAEFSVSLKSSV